MSYIPVCGMGLWTIIAAYAPLSLSEIVNYPKYPTPNAMPLAKFLTCARHAWNHAQVGPAQMLTVSVEHGPTLGV